MYRLFKRTRNGLEPIAQKYADHIKELGRAIVKETKQKDDA